MILSGEADMRVDLAYGKNGLAIELSDEWDVTVIEPTFVPQVPNPGAALSSALRNPIESPALNEFVNAQDRVGIIFSDITRPTPNHLLIPAVLTELKHVPRKNITLFNALGTHRANTETELRSMLGDELVDGYRIVQNDAFDRTTQENLGMSSRGHEIWLNRELFECDVKILTGFIEPHFFAGFSGGGKAVMPGMAGQTTVLGNHDAGMISSPKATWGITQGNPIWEEVQEVASRAGKLFLLNVSLNKHKQITGVFCGEMRAAHAVGCEFVRKSAMVPVDQPFDIAVTTNSGYPLDLNLYQAVKGMSAAAQIVREGGAILLAAECWDGIPEHGLYGQLLKEAENPQALLDKICKPGFLKQDQWQAQIQAQIQLKADVYVYSENLSDSQIREALLKPCRSIEETLKGLVAKFGPQARICILPEGPQTVPYVKVE
jgi:lactate racemase